MTRRREEKKVKSSLVLCTLREKERDSVWGKEKEYDEKSLVHSTHCESKQTTHMKPGTDGPTQFNDSACKCPTSLISYEREYIFPFSLPSNCASSFSLSLSQPTNHKQHSHSHSHTHTHLHKDHFYHSTFTRLFLLSSFFFPFLTLSLSLSKSSVQIYSVHVMHWCGCSCLFSSSFLFLSFFPSV